MTQRLSLLLVLLVVYQVNGCDQYVSDEETATTPEDPVASSDSPTASGIEWYSGSMEEAFAEAREQGKPLYLYWGAEWCPPCHAINATVFKSKAFIDRSRSFIAVYLDGDSPNAQAVGESYGVIGYPTMIVFDPAGQELTRIPGGIDLQAYANVLDLTLENVAPVTAALASVLEGDNTLSDTDCRLLAYYSWGQDRTILTDHDEVAVFRQLENACPEQMTLEKSILYLSFLGRRINAASAEENPQPLTLAEKREALQRVVGVLDDYTLVKANIFDVNFAGAEITAVLTDPGTLMRQQLTQKFSEAYEQLFRDDTIYLRERLYTMRGKVRFERIDDEDAAVSESLKDEIRTQVAWADETTTDPYERNPIINAAANILGEADMPDVAKPLLLNEIEHAKQPYYFMASLADIEQRAGNYDAALRWLKKAHAASTGPATRFQWGYYYVAGLIEMTPEDVESIQSATVDLVREVEASGGFHQRPKAQLQRLESKLKAWSEENGRADQLPELHDKVQRVCVKSAEERASVCQSFLEAV